MLCVCSKAEFDQKTSRYEVTVLKEIREELKLQVKNEMQRITHALEMRLTEMEVEAIKNEESNLKIQKLEEQLSKMLIKGEGRFAIEVKLTMIQETTKQRDKLKQDREYALREKLRNLQEKNKEFQSACDEDVWCL